MHTIAQDNAKLPRRGGSPELVKWIGFAAATTINGDPIAAGETVIIMLLIGVAGVLWGFFWLARSALRFARDASDKAERARVALPLLLVPYLAINVLFTILAIWHPLGGQGLFVVAFQYWFGYVGFFWGFFLAAYWLDVHKPLPNPVALPTQARLVWWIASGLTWLLAVAVLLPTI